MSDIFLSYASKDRERAADLAAALKACGWDVWWDRTLVAGDRYAAVIAEELAAARSVIVLWSQSSVASDWVADEANEAKKRGVYIPVLLDGTEPPLGFRSAQYANLSNWSGSLDDHEFERLLGGVRRHAGGGVTRPPASLWQRLLIAARPSRSAVVRSAIAALPIIALGVGLIILGRTPQRAQIRLVMTVSQATLIFKEVVDKGVLTGFPTSALTVTDFKSADLGFAALESAGPAVGAGPIRLLAVEAPASATFNDVQCEGVRLPAESRVTLAWRDGSLHLTSRDTALAVSFSTRPRLTLVCDGCAAASGDQKPTRLSASTPYTFLYSNSQIVTVDSESPGTGLTLDAPTGSVPMEGNIVLNAVEFLDADDNGRPVSAILSGQLEYVGLNRPPRELRDEEFVVPQALEDFYLTRVAVNAEGLSVEMHGRVGQLDVGPAGNIEPDLPTRLEQIMSQSPWIVYAGAALAVVMAATILTLGKRRPRL
jgi:hypothetical protein